jgi:hypothetical protein
MRKRFSCLFLASILVLVVAVAGCSSGTSAPQGEQGGKGQGQSGEAAAGLPKQMTWSTYDVGSSGYADVAAVANALTKTYGTQIRLLPSGTGVGRMVPMKDGTASFGRLGDESYFAFEGEYEFAAPGWGPQDMRIVWPVKTYLGLAVRADSDIQTPADLKGKKVPWVTANPSIYKKMEAALAFGGLTWDDVKRVDIPSYAAQAEALKNGQIDVAIMINTAAALYEVDSAVGIRWIDLPATDTEGWKRLQAVTPWVVPGKDSRGAGLKEGESKEFMSYVYPMAAYASADANTVYELIKAINETFDQYKDATPSLVDWASDKIEVTPAGVPFHDGLVKYLKEKGLWSEEAEAKNNELIARYGKLKEAWEGFLDEASKQGIGEKEFADKWLEWKKQHVQ